MNFSNEIKRCAKELSDDEIVTLYKKVKEKLDSQNKDEDQVLDGEKSGEEPMQSENNSLIPPVENIPAAPETPTDSPAETPTDSSEEDVDDSIDDLLNSLGLGDNPAQEEKQETEQVKEASGGDEDIIGEVLSGLDLETQPEESPAVKDITQETVDKNTQPDEFSPDNFKTAGQGFQINRKDKDLMSDDATGPKYKEPEKNPPRTDCRRPNGIRWNRGDEDKDVAGDRDLK